MHGLISNGDITSMETENRCLNIAVIKEKKKLYGNNLPDLSKAWSAYLDIDMITEKQVAHMLAMLKVSRIDQLRKELSTMTIGTDSYFIKRKALDDTEMDYANYMWISKNYRKYLAL